MNIQMERRLASFVDRVTEMDRFREMLDTREKSIMVVWGEAGLGKTSLFYRMIHECAERKLRKAEVVWTDTRNHTYVDVMSKIRDDVGVDHFRSFSELLDELHGSPLKIKIDVATDAQLNVDGLTVEGQSKVGDISTVKFQNSTFVVAPLQMADRLALENSRMIKLTDRFKEDLSRAVEQDPLVVFFDAVEKMQPDTSRWVWEELLRPVANGEYGKICFVLCGRKRPELERNMEFSVEEAELRPLGHKDIVEYLIKRGKDDDIGLVMTEEQLDFLAEALLTATKGRPDEIAYAVEGALRRRKKGLSSAGTDS